jgi:hypothetical protein
MNDERFKKFFENLMKVYNLWVTGDGTYIVNGYGTHSIMFDGGWMRLAYEQDLMELEACGQQQPQQ